MFYIEDTVVSEQYKVKTLYNEVTDLQGTLCTTYNNACERSQHRRDLTHFK